MEIKAQITNPTETERMNFIVEYNHNKGFEIQEKNIELENDTKELHLQAWGYTDEEIAEQEAEQLAKEFFNTSLGYVKRKVTMATGDVRDFLFDIKPTLQVGVPIITYNLDGTQNRGVLVTEQFLKECEKQVYYDFYGTMPTTEENLAIETLEEN